MVFEENPKHSYFGERGGIFLQHKGGWAVWEKVKHSGFGKSTQFLNALPLTYALTYARKPDV